MHCGKRHSLVSLLEAALGRCTGRLTSTDSIASTSQNPDGKYMFVVVFFFLKHKSGGYFPVIWTAVTRNTELPTNTEVLQGSIAYYKNKNGDKKCWSYLHRISKTARGKLCYKKEAKKNTKAKYYTSFLKGKASNFHTDGLSCHHNVLFLKAERSGDW